MISITISPAYDVLWKILIYPQSKGVFFSHNLRSIQPLSGISLFHMVASIPPFLDGFSLVSRTEYYTAIANLPANVATTAHPPPRWQRKQRIAARRFGEILCFNGNDVLWFDENDIDTMNVSGINCPNENDGTTIPVINYIKECIQNPWTQDV